MAIPDFQSFFKPFLEFCSDGHEHNIAEAREKLKLYFRLSEKDLAEILPSGNQTRFENRVAWTKSFLVGAKVLEATRRSWFTITARGLDLLNQGHEKITNRILSQYQEFVEFHSGRGKQENKAISILTESDTSPEEQLQVSYQNIRNNLTSKLLDQVKHNSPKFFENLVVDLMLAMGYGGSRIDAGKTIGQSGDEGIDGVINEDRLGLDIIYLQAKRWEGTIGRPEIQKFVGALHGKRAKKGVFITTGHFSEEATDYVKSIESKVALIDGKDLANFMIDSNIGVTTIANYQIKRVDTDYFIED